MTTARTPDDTALSRRDFLLRAGQLGCALSVAPTLGPALAASAGAAQPALAIPTQTQRRALRVRPFAAPVPGRTNALVWRRNTPLAPALRAVTGTITEVYARLLKATRRR